MDQQSLLSSGSRYTYDSLQNSRQISPIVQNHLKQVYLSVCWALIASTIGASFHITWNVGGFLTTMAALGCMLWLLATPPHQEALRVTLLMVFSILLGASIGPLINEIFSILVFVFMGTAIIFACFSGVAMSAKRIKYLYLGGLLSSGLGIYLGLQILFTIFPYSDADLKIVLYFGLLVVVGFVVFNTHKIIEKAHLGDLDFVKHALQICFNFLAICVLIFILMLCLKKDGRNRRRRSSSSSSSRIRRGEEKEKEKEEEEKEKKEKENEKKEKKNLKRKKKRKD